MKCRQVFIALAITLLATVPLAAQEKPTADPFEGFPEFVEKVMAATGMSRASRSQ